MEKPHASFLAASPWKLRHHKARLCLLCAAETWARGGHSEWHWRHHPSFKSSPSSWPPQAPPLRAPQLALPKAACISTWPAGGQPQIGTRGHLTAVLLQAVAPLAAVDQYGQRTGCPLGQCVQWLSHPIPHIRSFAKRTCLLRIHMWGGGREGEASYPQCWKGFRAFRGAEGSDGRVSHWRTRLEDLRTWESVGRRAIPVSPDTSVPHPG